jgi:hypothetical protein
MYRRIKRVVDDKKKTKKKTVTRLEPQIHIQCDHMFELELMYPCLKSHADAQNALKN